MLGFYWELATPWALILLGIVYGGLAFTVYGLSVAHVNDLITRDHGEFVLAWNECRDSS